MQPIFIAGYNQGGLIQDKKPFLIPDQAFAVLKNAYVFRDRVVQHEGIEFLGDNQYESRLKRAPTGLAQTATQAGATYTDTDLLSSVRATEPNAEILPGSVVITIDAGNPNETIYNDATTNGVLTYVSGTFTGESPIAGTINYVTGEVVITWTVEPGAAIAVEADLEYFPGLPVMGIWQREITGINDEQTIFFDTKYSYSYSTNEFIEFPTGTAVTWAGTDSDFFWCTNYRGAAATNRAFFATNFVCTTANPMRYSIDGGAWVSFAPIIADNPPTPAQSLMYQARILFPYYGRMIALNTWEGTTAGGYAGATNFYNRCRYSAQGDPTAANAWRTDIPGQGGLIDAPVNEIIVSCGFVKNTLIVRFERSTWQLRYVGEYGVPFIWERISSDFGGESTMSTVLFDDGAITVGDKAITLANGSTVVRVDDAIPDLAFEIRNAENGVLRVTGVRDFRREMVYWNYPDSDFNATGQKFPNFVLAYNYRNGTFAIFRDNVTFLGNFQTNRNITWDSLSAYWDDYEILWDDDPDLQSQFPAIVAGNQQGFVHYYAVTTSLEDASLSITGVDLTANPIEITVPNHNIEAGETILIKGMEFFDSGAPVATNLNDIIYHVAERIDADTLALSRWNFTDQYYQDLNYVNYPSITPANTADYIGGGTVTLLPKLFVQTKDFNPFAPQGNQVKVIYCDFLMDSTDTGAFSVELYVNTSQSVKANVITGNQESETYLPATYYVPESDIAWHRFYATANGQFIRVVMTFDDDLMNTLATHQEEWVLNAMALWVRSGGKIIF